MEIINGKEYYTTSEIMEKVGIGKSTLFKYIKRGRIKALSLRGQWLFTKESLEEFLTPQLCPPPIKKGGKNKK